MDITKIKQFRYYLDNISSEFNNLIKGGVKDLIECNNFAEKHITDSFEKQCNSKTSKEIHVKLKGGEINNLENIKRILDKIEYTIINLKKYRLKNVKKILEKLERYIKNHKIKKNNSIYIKLNILKKYIKEKELEERQILQESENTYFNFNNIIIFIIIVILIIIVSYNNYINFRR